MAIHIDHLRKHAARSKERGVTSALLRHFVFTVVDHALREHYGNNYSIRCLQGSAAVQIVLGHLGISSRLWRGATCYPLGFTNEPRPPREIRFGGFWGPDHHVWCVTEFQEFVDLTISQQHIHPGTGRKDTLPLLPLWWDTKPGFVETIKYLPEVPLVEYRLDAAEREDHDAFSAQVIPVMEQVMRERDSREIDFGTILEGVDTLNRLIDRGDPWATQALVYRDLGVPFPDWVCERERELTRLYQERSGR